MEKENVLELEITTLNDEYSLVKVTKIKIVVPLFLMWHLIIIMNYS